MKNSNSVFRIQYKLFLREKGMLIFYFLLVLMTGVVVPIFYQGIQMLLSFLSLLIIMLIKPMLADSLAGERERKTLESLLSTPLPVKSIIWGKIKFYFVFSALFFLVTASLMIITLHFFAHQIPFSGWQWICICSALLLNLITICMTGVYYSAQSDHSYTANSKISKIAYSFIFLQIVYLSVIFQGQLLIVLVLSIPFLLIELCMICFHIYKIQKLKQADIINIAEKTQSQPNHTKTSALSPKSQFEAVVRHELKYLLKLKTLLINFMILCACPVLVVCILYYYFGTVNLYYAVILTSLMMPRAPVNLIAYSIGGEKAYKTGESLLSTPIRLLPLFLAKCIIPIVISAIMLILSSLLTLAGANVIGIVFESGNTYFYTIDQLILLIPVSIMSCITMVFITGVLSVSMKTPRQGLYLSSMIGVIFVVPILMIVYLTQNPLIWSILYFIILFLITILLIKKVIHNVSRPVIINKL